MPRRCTTYRSSGAVATEYKLNAFVCWRGQNTLRRVTNWNYCNLAKLCCIYRLNRLNNFVIATLSVQRDTVTLNLKFGKSIQHLAHLWETRWSLDTFRVTVYKLQWCVVTVASISENLLHGLRLTECAWVAIDEMLPNNSPDTLKFPDISVTIPSQCAALMPMLSGTHSMPIVLVFTRDSRNCYSAS